MQTVTLKAQFVPKGTSAMPSRRLVRGRERARLMNFLKRLRELEARDAKVTVPLEASDFKGMLIFDYPAGQNLPFAASLIRERILSLLAARV